MREITQRGNNQSPRTNVFVRIIPVIAVSVLLAVTAMGSGASSITPYQADLSGNTIVDFPDFAKLANNFGKTGAGLEGDLTGDEVVDFNDVRALASLWQDVWIAISDVNDLNDIRNDLSGCYIIENDIDCNGFDFKSIGTESNPFTGTIDGRGYSISNLTINEDKNNVGLLGFMDGEAYVKNLTLDVNIVGQTSVGALAGTVGNGKIEQVATSGTVEAKDSEGGGIAGTMIEGNIENCSSECVVAGNQSVGGILGYGNGSDSSSIVISKCYATGDTTASHSAGGLGGKGNMTITDSYATGTVSASFFAGGLVGRPDVVNVFNSYFTDIANDNGYGYPEYEGETAFYGKDHDVYFSWDFDEVWEERECALPRLKGHGSADTVRIIRTVQDLQNIADYLCGDYVLENDIDCNGVDFEPIGNENNPFTGSLIGNGYSINNLTLDRRTEDNVGLFRFLDGAEISDLGIKDVNIVGKVSVGTVAANVEDATLYKIAASGTVEARNQQGGGLVGKISKGLIEDSYSGCDITGTSYLGGLVGSASGDSPDSIVITKSYSDGNVSADLDACGGIIGLSRKATVMDSYSTGQIAGLWSVGGVVGENQGDTNVVNSYYTNAVDESGLGDRELSGEPAFYGSSHAVYNHVDNPWDFAKVWQAYSDALPTLRGQD